VTTPWGIEFHEDILSLIHDDILVIKPHNNRNRALLFLRNRLALNTRLNLSIEVILRELSNILISDFLILGEWEFLVLGNVLNGKGGEFIGFEIEVSGVGAKGFGVDGGEVDGSFVFFGDGLEFEGQSVALLGGFGEDVGEWDSSLDYVC
jgi:hypothetical protein